MDRKPKIIITGAGGFSGRHACEYFEGAGMSVTALVRKPGEEPLPGAVVSCDILRKAELADLFREIQPDYVLHLAGRNSVAESWEQPELFMETNVMGTIHVLEAVRSSGKAHCRTAVVGSMLSFPLSEEPEPPHPYSMSKTLQVIAARCWKSLYNLHVSVIQPVNLVGPGPTNGICGLLAKRIVQWEQGAGGSKPFQLSTLEEPRDYLDIRDAVRAYGRILTDGKSGAAYTVGTGKLHTLREVTETFSRLATSALKIEVSGSRQPTVPPVLDVKPLQALGWSPIIPFEQSLSDMLDYCRSASRRAGIGE
jgi:nucleoside-diphosphate-sugar epimerase